MAQSKPLPGYGQVFAGFGVGAPVVAPGAGFAFGNRIGAAVVGGADEAAGSGPGTAPGAPTGAAAGRAAWPQPAKLARASAVATAVRARRGVGTGRTYAIPPRPVSPTPGRAGAPSAKRRPLRPGDGPVVDVAVPGGERDAGAGDLDDVAGPGEAEEPLRVGGREVDAAVRDVGRSLLGDRPRCRVDELPTVGDPGGPLHVRGVAARVQGEAERGGVHVLDPLLLDHHVHAVVGEAARHLLAHRGGEVLHQRAAVVDQQAVGRRVGHAVVPRADGERHVPAALGVHAVG